MDAGYFDSNLRMFQDLWPASELSVARAVDEQLAGKPGRVPVEDVIFFVFRDGAAGRFFPEAAEDAFPNGRKARYRFLQAIDQSMEAVRAYAEAIAAGRPRKEVLESAKQWAAMQLRGCARICDEGSIVETLVLTTSLGDTDFIVSGGSHGIVAIHVYRDVPRAP